MRKRKKFYEYPIRTCYSRHHCEVCAKGIFIGEKYYDGGLYRRCHVACAPPNKPNEPDPSHDADVECNLCGGNHFDFECPDR